MGALTLLPDGQTSGCGASVALCAAAEAPVTTALVPAGGTCRPRLRLGGRRGWVVRVRLLPLPVINLFWGRSGDSWLELAGSWVNLKQTPHLYLERKPAYLFSKAIQQRVPAATALTWQ